MTSRLMISAVLGLLLAGSAAWAVARSMDHGGVSPLIEPGQGAFAALSEVVALLESDPDTDWAKVDLTGLRNHLVDMDRLVMDASVREEPLADGLRATVTGDADVLATSRRMIPAHAAELRRDDQWEVAAEVTGSAVILTVTSDDPATVARIRGLGFFGLMASQDHHREHHYAIATGGGVHDRHPR